MAKKKAAERPARAAAPRRTEPVYTVITFVTFVAMAIGCTLLYLDWDEYGKTSPAKENVPALPKLGDGGTAGPPVKGGGEAVAP